MKSTSGLLALVIAMVSIIGFHHHCYSQPTPVQESNWSIGFDIGVRSTLNTISFEGTMLSDADPALDEWWSDNASTASVECSPSLSFGVHILTRVMGIKDATTLSIGIRASLDRFRYADRDWSYSSYTFRRFYNDYSVHSINIMPAIRVDAHLTPAMRVIVGLNAGVALFGMSENLKSDRYDVEEEEPWGVFETDDYSSTTAIVLNPSVGLIIAISNRFAITATYDFQIVDEARFAFDAVERTGITPSGNIWRVASYDREHYLRNSSHAFRTGFEVSL